MSWCAYKARTMKSLKLTLLAPAALALAACNPPPPPVAQPSEPYECIPAKITIGTNTVDTVVRYNKMNGEAQLLNAAAFASKATGAQGNLIGWVPLGDLRAAVQELMQREQAAQQQSASMAGAAPQLTAPASEAVTVPTATASPSPEAKKKK